MYASNEAAIYEAYKVMRPLCMAMYHKHTKFAHFSAGIVPSNV